MYQIHVLLFPSLHQNLEGKYNLTLNIGSINSSDKVLVGKMARNNHYLPVLIVPGAAYFPVTQQRLLCLGLGCFPSRVLFPVTAEIELTRISFK